MTEKTTVRTYLVPAPDCHRHDIHHYFECECGKQQRVDTWTECKRCGAHYRLVEDKMALIAPPVERFENE